MEKEPVSFSSQQAESEQTTRQRLLRQNFHHLYWDVLWYGLLAGSTLSFIAIYAARLGATSFQIGLLTAGPAALNLLFSLPAGRILQGRPLIRTTFLSVVVFRAGFLALIPLAWFLDQPGQIQAVIWITLLMAIPGTLMAISFSSMLPGVVPAEMRGEVIGRRNALVAISTTVTTLVCGLLLDRIAFAFNYQLVFAVGALGAALSAYHLGQLKMIDAPAPRPVERLKFSIRPSELRLAFQSLLRLDLLKGRYGRFMFAYLLFYTFQYIPLPLFPLAFVNVLNLTDGQISLGNGVFYAVMVLVSLRLGRITKRVGNHRLLAFSAILFSGYPLLIGLARDAGLYWAASLLGGAVWALISASSLNRLMEVTPAGERPACMSLHNLVLNLGILVGSLSAPWLSGHFGLQEAILIGSALRLVAGIVLIFWG